jgi:DNA helicase II / ATP-dependent DNA helicase PcrA
LNKKPVQDILSQLNEAQYEAVVNINGPSLVLAGAGSGKTRVLTYRIAHLLNNNVKPSSILALTFTNKAAAEMKGRIAILSGQGLTRYLWMGTFHAIFSRILRAESDKLGFPSSFTIYDSSDSKSLIKTIIKDLKLDDKVYKPGYVQSRMSLAKNNLITPKAYAANAQLTEHDGFNAMPRLSEIYAIYFDRCKKAGAMDFDDLLLYTNILFRDFPEVLQKYRQFFRYILVDEYQDTNMAQYLIVKKLAEEHRNICVVGDDAQSIYSFRGAKVDNILKFPNDFQGCKVFKLEQNYRSTQTIVEAANSLINKNVEQFKKNTFSQKQVGNKIGVISAFSDFEEGVLVVNKMSELLMRDHFEYSDFAILYRTNAQSRIFEESLRKRNIPYKIYGGLSFYQRKEIKDVLAYLRILINPADDEAFKRIINYPARGLGKTTIDKLTDTAALHQVPSLSVTANPLAFNLQVNAGTANKLVQFFNLVKQLAELVSLSDAYEVAYQLVHKTGIVAELKADKSTENISRLENIDELLNGIKDFVESRREQGEPMGLVDFLQEVALLTDQDNEKDEDRNKVALMTIHASKGLEFKNVFVVGLEEELFPSAMCIDSPKELEEERRLFYVAITRSELNCTLSYAKSRYKYGTPVFL